MKKLMLALATCLTMSAFAPAFADEISVMFKPEGGPATEPYGVEFGEDADGTTLMCIKGDDAYQETLMETIEKVVKNGISGTITAIFNFQIHQPGKQPRAVRERILLFGDFAKDGHYFLWGYTHDGKLIRWYIPEDGGQGASQGDDSTIPQPSKTVTNPF